MLEKKGPFTEYAPEKALGKYTGYLLWLPGIGILCFLLFYLLAALNYPGGSAAHPTRPGFDIWNNYLCDLLDEIAINGSLNTARYFARWALFSLCAGLLLLWGYLPKLFDKKTLTLHVMRLSGILALVTLFFMATQNHDLIVRIAGVFGVIAIISCSYALIKEGYTGLGILGFLCCFVFLTNYYIYETGIYIKGLPLIQKVTFLLCLSWFVGLNFGLYKKLNRSNLIQGINEIEIQ